MEKGQNFESGQTLVKGETKNMTFNALYILSLRIAFTRAGAAGKIGLYKIWEKEQTFSDGLKKVRLFAQKDRPDMGN